MEDGLQAMINSKQELNFYIQADRMMNIGYFTPSLGQSIKNFLMPNYIMRYLKVLRKSEYFSVRGGYSSTGISTNSTGWGIKPASRLLQMFLGTVWLSRIMGQLLSDPEII